MAYKVLQIAPNRPGRNYTGLHMRNTQKIALNNSNRKYSKCKFVGVFEVHLPVWL